MLVAELEEKREEKERVVNGCFPPLKLSGMSIQELQVQKAIVLSICPDLLRGTSCHVTSPLQDLCADLHKKIDVVDEARYDIQSKVARNEKEVNLKRQPTAVAIW